MTKKDFKNMSLDEIEELYEDMVDTFKNTIYHDIVLSGEDEKDLKKKKQWILDHYYSYNNLCLYYLNGGR